MDSGWIKLYRSMTSCKTASRGLNFFGAMAWLVVKANYEDGWYKGDKIGRGQLFVGLSYLAKEWKVGIRVVRTILQHLEIDEFLTSKSTNKGRIITICNYDSYQLLPDDYRQADRQAPDKQPTSNRQATDNFQELKEVKELKEYNTPPVGDPKRSVRKPYRIIFEYDGDERIHGIVQKDLDDWKEFYPALDIEAELKAASAWLKGNRTQRKKNVLKFLTGWLQRAQDRARKSEVGGNLPGTTADEQWERMKQDARINESRIIQTGI